MLEEWGHKVSQSSVQNCYRAFFPVGDEARKFNALAIAFSGVEIEDALQSY
ncbi:hypothetical protein [Nostoc sp.]|uniref:hypothetical protein n=1 Tax=Nostoc sp. TaxID=1180 RepID=UPI002FF870B0